MKIALIHAEFDAAHLEVVKADMGNMGAPTIKAVWMACYDMWVALEGCHRIRAAAALGLVPVIEEVEYSDEVTTEDLGLDLQDIMTVAEICDVAHRAEIINFED